MDPILERYQALEDKIKTYNPALDTQRLFSAFNYADNAHSGQLRKDGTPYITHPLAVAEIVADLELDTDSIIAALLHDCIEDTGSTYEEIAKLFGTAVANLVEGVTKLTRVQYTSKEEEQMENLRKMLLAMAKDIRVILIKICDRLHNMRTMEYQSARKQREKALETMEIYAPIAHRLGMQNFKWELEDLSLRYLDPIGYKEIEDELAARSSAHEEFLATVQKRIQDRMDEEGIKCTVYGRVKHIYSCYRKMYAQNKTMDEIFDLYAFRVIVDDISECYNVLGCIHDLFKPMLGRFKDYIGTPKPNGYQSLHTTVIGREGIPFEVQIRTKEMHQTAEYGIAAHWKYKQGMANEKLGTEEAFEWVRKLLESQQDTDAEEFVRTLKVDMFADEVFVFTPRGDVINLPAGATPIDFAYNIHSAVGNQMTGAKVNGRMVPFDTQLKNGDIVEVITSKAAKGPSRDWLKIVKTARARSRIQRYLRTEERAHALALGRDMLEKEGRKVNLNVARALKDGQLAIVAQEMNFENVDELVASVGYAHITPRRVLNKLYAVLHPDNAAAAEPATPTIKESKEAAKRKSDGVGISGCDGVLMRFAKCCNPVPGDPIIGYISRGMGVTVHRADCPNVANMEPERLISVHWDGEEEKPYEAGIFILAQNRSGVLAGIAQLLALQGINITALSSRALVDGRAELRLTVEVCNATQLYDVIEAIRGQSGILEVVRDTEEA